MYDLGVNQDPTALEDEEARREARRKFLEAQNPDVRAAATEVFKQTALPNDQARAAAAANPSFTPTEDPIAPARAPDPLAPLSDATAPRSNAGMADIAKQIGPDTTKSTTVSKEVQSKEEKEAQKKATDTLEEGKGVVQKKTDLEVKKAEDEALATTKEANTFTKLVTDADTERATRLKQWDDSRALLQKEQEKYAKTEIKDIYDGRTAASIGAALMVGLGAGASVLTGTPNYALQIIDKARDNYRRLQLDNLQQSKEMLQLKKENIGLARERMELADIDLKNREAGLLKKMAIDREARLRTYGADDARVQGDQLLQGINERIASLNLSVEQSLRKKISSTTQTSNANQNAMKLAALGSSSPDKPIEKADANERKSDHFTNMAFQSYRQLKNLDGYSDKDLKELAKFDAQMASELARTKPEMLSSTFSALRGTIANRLSPEGRARLAAETTLINSTLRPETGAAIGPKEYTDRALELRAARGEDKAGLQRKDASAVGYIAGNAIQSFRPGYWNQALHAVSGNLDRMTTQEAATLMELARREPNSPRGQEARRLLQARAQLSGGM